MTRPRALVAIVLYKIFTATLLTITSIALFFTLKNYTHLLDLADDYTLEGKSAIIQWLLEKIINLNPRTLKFSAIATGLYAIITAIEALGLWYEQVWATILVLVMVGISIPVEVFEIIKRVSPIKLIVFLINVAVFWYLLRHELEKKKHRVS